jgi:type VI secretion system protein ImpG
VHHIQVKGLVCDRGWRAGSAVNARYRLEESKAVEKIECLWAASAPRPMPDANECWTALPHLGDNPLGQYSAKATDITDRIKDLLCLASVGSNAMDVQRSSSLRKVFATPVFMEAGRSSPMAWVRGQKVSIFVSSSDHPDKGAWLFGRVLAQALFESVYLNDGVEFEIYIDDELCSTHTNLNNKTGALL